MSRMHAFQSTRAQQRSVAAHAQGRRRAASTSAGVAASIGAAVVLLTSAGDPAHAKGFFDEQNERNAAISQAESKLERLFEESQKKAKSAASTAQKQVRFCVLAPQRGTADSARTRPPRPSQRGAQPANCYIASLRADT